MLETRIAMEIANGTTALVCAFILIIFFRYIITDISRNYDYYFGEEGFSVRKLFTYVWGSGHYSSLAAAIGLITFFFGLVLTRTWVWIWRYQINHGIDNKWMDSYPVVLIGAIATVIGALCIARVFTPEKWHPLTWAAAGAASFLIPTIMALWSYTSYMIY